ncbi:hypothetical protein B0H19DRAFT_1385152 [Mycena capillaripes]|nr:hypothetical protein B0H19DRAFT_1385152 [Mycena capillaripes]
MSDTRIVTGTWCVIIFVLSHVVFSFTSDFQSIAIMPRAKPVVTQPRPRNTEFNLRAWNKARREHHKILERIESQDLPAGKIQELKNEQIRQFIDHCLSTPSLCVVGAVVRCETRTRANRQKLRDDGFEASMPGMIANFISWKAHQRGDPKRWEKTFPSKAPSPPSAETEVDADEFYIPVLDIFSLEERRIDRWSSEGWTTHTFLRHGVIPSAPYSPAFGVTIRTMELLQSLRILRPGLPFTPFIKALCELHLADEVKVSTLGPKFSISHKLYLSIVDGAHNRIFKELRGAVVDGRLKDCCPACSYDLPDEIKLHCGPLDVCASQPPLQAHNPSRKAIDHWLRGLLNADLNTVLITEHSSSDVDSSADLVYALVSRAWAIYDRTGSLVALCRHGLRLLTTELLRDSQGERFPAALTQCLLPTVDICTGQQCEYKLSSLALQACPPDLESRFTSQKHLSRLFA